MTKNHKLLVVILVALLNSIAYSLPKPATAVKRQAVAMDLTMMALRLPNENRIAALKDQGAGAIENLKSLAANPKETLNNRWKAITAIGQIDATKNLPFLEKFLTAREWFLRSAALHAIKFGPRSEVLKWSKKLLDDPALIVRSSAVQTIDYINGKELKAALWERLYSANN